jgi:hypothetical protein
MKRRVRKGENARGVIDMAGLRERLIGYKS